MKLLRRVREARTAWPGWARAFTSRWVVLPAAIIVLFSAAFLGYGAYTRSRPTTFSRGNPDFGALPSAEPAASATGPAPSAQPSITASPSVLPTSTPTTRPSGASPVPVPQGGITLPKEGTYRLAVDGSERVEFGFVSPCSRTFPAQSALTVRRSAGESGTSFDFDHRFYPGQPDQHDERHIYRYAAAGVFLDYEQATVTCAGIKQSTVISFSPPQEKVRFPLSVGASWSGRGGNEDRTESYSARVLRSESLRVEGRGFTTYVIETRITLTGEESGSRLQRWWYAPALGVPLRMYQEISASRMGATYSMTATFTVVALP